MRKFYPIAVTSFLILVSCQKLTKSEPSESNDSVTTQKNIAILQNDNHKSQNSLDYIGLYKGILPCADCEGIATEMVINENFTYSIKSKYIGKGNKTFEEKGTFKWNDSGNSILLVDRIDSPNQYFVGENYITQLDASGNKISGDLELDYILQKVTNSSTEFDKTSIEIPTTVNLNDRMSTKTVIKSVNPSEGKFALAKTKWILVELNGTLIKNKSKKSYHIKLNSKDGRFSAYAGCNNLMGNYVMASSFELSFSKVASTMMACPEMELEQQFITMLENVDNYTIRGKYLQLNKAKMATLAKFEAI
jgi:copper homeostasis protein (lipoprotein)